MQIKATPDVLFSGVVESPPLEDVVVLADSAGVALGVQRAFSARVRSVRDDGSGLIASRCVEIPLVGSDGEVSGILCHTRPRPDTRGAVGIESRLGARTLVRLFLPLVGDSAVLSSLAGTEIAYTPSPDGGVFHIVNPAKAAPTS